MRDSYEERIAVAEARQQKAMRSIVRMLERIISRIEAWQPQMQGKEQDEETRGRELAA